MTFRDVDDCLIARTRSSLDFLFDWFGFTQKIVERALIVVFGLSNFVECVSVFLKIPNVIKTHPISWQFNIFLASAMIVSFWRRHKLPSAARAAENHTLGAVVFRILLFTVSVSIIVHFCFDLDMSVYGLSVDIDAWSFTLLSYVFATDMDGSKKKSGKLAWSKIKELFGTAWIPQPKGAL